MRCFRFIWIAMLVVPTVGLGQVASLSLAAAEARALARHPLLRVAAADVARQQALRQVAVSLPQPELITEAPSGTFYTPGVTQVVHFPVLYVRQRQAADAYLRSAEASQSLWQAEVRYRVRVAYLEAQAWSARMMQLNAQDTALAAFVRAAELRHRLGQTRYLDLLSGQTASRQAQQRRLQAEGQLHTALARLALLIGADSVQIIELDSLGSPSRWPELPADLSQLPALRAATAAADASARLVQVARSALMPKFSLGYLNQGPAPNNPAQMNFRFGISLPLWWWQWKGSIRAAQADAAAASARRDGMALSLSTQALELRNAARQADQALATFDERALAQADELQRASQAAYQLGDTPYTTYLTGLDQAFGIRLSYVEALVAAHHARFALDLLAGTATQQP